MRHITRQASINASASVWYPIYKVKQANLLTKDESIHIIFENRRQLVRAWVRITPRLISLWHSVFCFWSILITEPCHFS